MSRSRPRTVAVGRRAALALAVVVLVPMAAAQAAVSWTKVATPNRGTVASALLDVAAVPNSTTAWAVGYSYDSSVAAYRTLTERWNGTSWRVVASPNASANGYSELTKVDATAANNVWAIGYDTSLTTGLILRYNGSSWSRVTAPAGIALRGIDAVSPTEVWVAGYSGSQATVARWSNGSWSTRFTLPANGRHLSVFEGITVDSPGQVWAVGWDRDYDAPGRPVSSLVAHFDGSTWTREATPNPENRNILMDVAAVGSDVFAVGVAQDTSGGGIAGTPLILRKHAGAWSSLAAPAGDESDGQLQSVVAVSATSVWTVGYYYASGQGIHQPLLMQWTANGGAGTLRAYEPAPALGVAATAWGVAATPSGTVWAVGYQSTSSGDRTLALRGTGG
jgi:hypothetical protein